jgi:prepilin-type N-terminal cleavage/methylation domain-containing protein
MLKLFRKPKRRKGFTLVELVTTVAIIAVITGVAMPLYQSAQDSARLSAAEMNITILRQAMMQFVGENEGNYQSIWAGGGAWANLSPFVAGTDGTNLREHMNKMDSNITYVITRPVGRAGMDLTVEVSSINMPAKYLDRHPNLHQSGFNSMRYVYRF